LEVSNQASFGGVKPFELDIDAPGGLLPGLWLDAATTAPTLVLAHGAGTGMRSPFMAGIAEGLAAAGVATLRFEFPYMAAGRKAPDRPERLIESWRAAFAAARERAAGPVLAGGKSMGGRIASMAAAEGMPAAGLVFLGYPLHPPGRPERIRDAHLPSVTVPMLFVQGTRDTFARPDLLDAVLTRLGPLATRLTVEGGDHSFRVPGDRRDGHAVGASLAEAVAGFVSRVAGTVA
jgi:predicted alpha/beta-hydrolase family hydrolase